MKAAGNRPSSSKEATRKVSSSSSRNYSKQQTESVKESPRHKKIIELTSREMTKSLIMEDTCSDSQMQRSNSFHCNAKVNITIGSIKNATIKDLIYTKVWSTNVFTAIEMDIIAAMF